MTREFTAITGLPNEMSCNFVLCKWAVPFTATLPEENDGNVQRKLILVNVPCGLIDLLFICSISQVL